jgi:hypothetical protein
MRQTGRPIGKLKPEWDAPETANCCETMSPQTVRGVSDQIDSGLRASHRMLDEIESALLGPMPCRNPEGKDCDPDMGLMSELADSALLSLGMEKRLNDIRSRLS